MAGTIEAYGWALHFTGGRSDKYYTMMVVDTLAIAHFGRRGTAGQFKVYVTGSRNDAIRKAQQKSNEKDMEKGYSLTCDFTVFEVDAAVVEMDPLAQANRAVLDKACAAFQAAAVAQGTLSAGATV